MANLSVHQFISSGDPLELRVMQLVANRVYELQELRDRNLAVRIRNEVMEGLGGK